VSDVWSQRAQLYRESDAHREGPDLDLLVEWSSGAQTALDVAAGGGHVARRLREAELHVVTCDAAPGMQPDVVCRAESLPFADGSFDVVVSRLGGHHFEHVQAAVDEMARVASECVLIVDNLFVDEALEQAELVRDATHVRTYTESEWRSHFGHAGLAVDDVRHFERSLNVARWLERTGCSNAEAERVRALAAAHISDGVITLQRIALKGRT
jgi:ubiquinone/menaquinone biosynthesis C-methylase UbiE